MKNFPGSIIVNTLSAQISDFIAVILGGIVFNKLGPQQTFITMYSLITIGSLLLIKYGSNLSLVPVFIFIAQFGASANLNNICTASVQLVPTMFSSTIFGYSNVVGRTVTILAPQVAETYFPTP